MSATSIKGSIGKDHYKVILQAGKNTIIADEPESSGGKDEGMNPHEILACALGACTCATLRMYADRKEMILDQVDVSVVLTKDDQKNETNMRRMITLTGDLTPEERDRLLQIAEKCPVHKTLTNPIHIQTTLINP
jgi:putative redox protein